VKEFIYKYSFVITILIIVFVIGAPVYDPISKFVMGQSTTAATPTPGPFDDQQAHTPYDVKKNQPTTPVGLTPQQIYSIYHLPGRGGTGTIALIDGFDDPNAQGDLNTFDATYGLPPLPPCVTATQTACFEKHEMSSGLSKNGAWAFEEALDTEWSHAIAPSARILLVEANSGSGKDLISALSYAAARSDVVSVSMSWGIKDTKRRENLYDNLFTNQYGTTFFASSGDNGTGVMWPSVAQTVVAVGGTTLNFVNGVFSSETAWNDSGGGLSQYESEPAYQITYGVQQTGGYRAVPDVSFDGDPNSGVSVYDSTKWQGLAGWFATGGTSVGSPVWAAIRSVGGPSVNDNAFYRDAATSNYPNYLRDITSGTNGTCGYLCTAQPGYDYVTGLGSPLTVSF
jgi:subtilase family serine protease